MIISIEVTLEAYFFHIISSVPDHDYNFFEIQIVVSVPTAWLEDPC